MKPPSAIPLRDGPTIPILHEDRSILAIDKPAGWMLAPDRWIRTSRNLQAALTDSIRVGDHWARSRRIDYLRYVHRLDADTSGVLLLARNPGVISAFSRLFADRLVAKVYFAVIQGVPRAPSWTCSLRLAPDPNNPERVRVDTRQGQVAETRFRVLGTEGDLSLVEAVPLTGRTHQVRVHLASAGHPVLGDPWYGPENRGSSEPPGRAGRPRLALRAIALSYRDPFRHCQIRITAPAEAFLKEFGCSKISVPVP